VAKNAKITVQYSHSYELTPSRQNKKSPSVLIHGAAALKVPKREIFDRSDFPDFYTIKSLREGDCGVKI
jgi:hypothetical protein